MVVFTEIMMKMSTRPVIMVVFTLLMVGIFTRISLTAWLQRKPKKIPLSQTSAVSSQLRGIGTPLLREAMS